MELRSERCSRDWRADIFILFVTTGIHCARHEFKLMTAAVYHQNKPKTFKTSVSKLLFKL